MTYRIPQNQQLLKKVSKKKDERRRIQFLELSEKFQQENYEI